MSHDHEHEHDHHHHDHGGHSHDHAPKDFGRRFAFGISLQAAFVVGEIIVGLASNSLAVLADAGHNVSDVLALALAWAAASAGRRKASKGRTYGWRGASILAALANALMLVFVNGGVAWEAIGRFETPEAVAPVPIIVVSLVGVVVNAASAWLFASGSKDDVNLRAAFLHLASDAAVAAGVAVTGLLIHFTGLHWIDSAASLAVSAIVLASTWSLLKRAVNLALHAVPDGIDEDEIRRWLANRPGVIEVHDLHVWAMSTKENVLTAHLVVSAMPKGARACEIDAELQARFPVHHVTLQFEPEGAPCGLLGPGSI